MQKELKKKIADFDAECGRIFSDVASANDLPSDLKEMVLTASKFFGGYKKKFARIVKEKIKIGEGKIVREKLAERAQNALWLAETLSSKKDMKTILLNLMAITQECAGCLWIAEVMNAEGMMPDNLLQAGLEVNSKLIKRIWRQSRREVSRENCGRNYELN